MANSNSHLARRGKDWLKAATRRFGFDLVPFPEHNQDYRQCGLIIKHDIRRVVDVGANRGDYGLMLRRFGFTGLIDSYEPVSALHARLAATARLDPNWTTRRLAIGATSGEVTINVAANDARSSSVLPMLKAHEAAAPDASYIGTEEVSVVPLDSLYGPDDLAGMFVKVDVQGYERAVLQGAHRLLQGVSGVQIEMSLRPLYEGAIGYADVLDTMGSYGLRLRHVVPGFWDEAAAESLQFDGVFVRDRTD